MKILLFFSLFLVFWEQNATSQEQFKIDNLTGILLLYSGKYTEKTSYKIFNKDKTLFAEIKSINGNEPSCPKLKGKILAYFDDYYIFHFMAKFNKVANIYEIKVGNFVKTIQKDSSMKFITRQEYILKFNCRASKENPLKDLPTVTSKEIKIDYGNTSFKCLEIKGDWVRVECNQECEGCPQGKKVKGWIRWGKDGKIILHQFFVC